MPDRRPGEAAYVLGRSKASDPWTYLGVGRWSDEVSALPEVDFDTWRALGSGRSA